MKTEKLKNFFEYNNFIVELFKQDNKQCAELEMWTDGGVDMIITLNPFTKEEFIDYVNSFDVDEEIDIHRQSELYRNDFKITESVKDFTDYHNKLKTIVEDLNTL